MGSYNLTCEMGTSLATLPKVPEFNERSRQLQFADDQYHNSGGAQVTPSFSDFSFYPDKYNLPRSQQKGFVDQKPSEDVGVVFAGQKLPTYHQSTPSGFDVAFTQEQDATKVSVTPNNPESSLELTTQSRTLFAKLEFLRIKSRTHPGSMSTSPETPGGLSL